MSAGQISSNPNFWDSNSRKIIFVVGSAVVGGSQVYHNQKENQYKDKMLAYKRVQGLTKGTLNPYQYVMRAADDGIPTHQMKEELNAWGKKWKGTNFANPGAFNVTETWRPREELGAKLLGQKERVFKLDEVRTKSESEFLSSDGRFNSAATATQKGKNVVRLDGRGGSTQPLKEQLENGIEMSTKPYKYSPNSVSNVDAEEVQGKPVVWRSFTCTSPQQVGPMPYYLFSIVLVFTGTVAVSYVQHKFSKWLKPTIPKNRTLGNTSGEEQELGESATNATPQCLLEIFKSYQNKTISKTKAVFILVNFYNLSKAEAVKLLDE